MLKKKVLISWSTGKDSTYALQQIRQLHEYEVVGLLSTITESYDRVSMHSTRYELLMTQAERMNIPLYPIFIPLNCTNQIYEACMQMFLEQAIHQGITHIVFGDLFLEDIKKYRELLLANTNIKPLFPLWKKQTLALAKEMIHAGIKAVITCIDPKKLDASFVGRQFDESLLNDLPNEVDPCGENGEFHTFVYDCAMFENPIPIRLVNVVEREGYIFIDVIPQSI